MSVISISGGKYSGTTEIAQRVARRLGCKTLADGVFYSTAEEFGVPELRPSAGGSGSPSVFHSLRSTKEYPIACLRAVLLRHICDDDVVYHGPAGAFFLKDVHHAFKVRILADIEERVAAAAAREDVSEDRAQRIVAKEDDARCQWALHAFGTDPDDQALYDAVIHVGRLGVDGVIDVICQMAGQDSFQATAESNAATRDLALSAYVAALIMDTEPSQVDAEVTAKDGVVVVRLHRTPRIRAGTSPEFKTHYVEDLQRRLLRRCIGKAGIKSLTVEVGAG